MLVRILADNPGKSFTRNLDTKFVSTVKELLREGRDASVQQILRETLDNFETQKANDETLEGLREMWKKEKLRMQRKGDTVAGAGGVGIYHISREQTIRQLKHPPPQQLMPRNLAGNSFIPHPQQQQNYFARQHHTPRSLPPPAELAQRIEEAKTSAKLLSQVVQSTPSSEVLQNDLIKEFADRCQSASRSIQGYIHSDNPPPDEDTLLTLIETNDFLATAMSKHQRAMLQARKAISPNPSPNPLPQTYQNGPYEAPSGPPPNLQSQPQRMSFTAPLSAPPNRRPPQTYSPPPLQTQPAPTQPYHNNSHARESQNPFGDPSPNTEPDMPPPLSPSYGLPPPGISGPSSKSANDEGGAYRPSYTNALHAPNQYGSKSLNDEGGVYRPGYSAQGGSSSMQNGIARGGDEDSSDAEERRRPVQYRF